MESPEADKRHLNKLEKQVDTLFARIPTPADPMKAARAPTRDELEENEKLESLKEVMRDRYRSQQMKKNAESKRIDEAMRAVEDGTYEAKYAKTRPGAVRSDAEEAKMTPEQIENINILRELEETKRKMKELQAQLEAAVAAKQQEK